MPRLDRTVGMRNKVETRLKKCKKGGKTAIFLLVDSENFNSTSSVEKMAKELFNATKNMKDFYPVILVGGSSATDQMGMDKAVRILRRRTKLDIVSISWKHYRCSSKSTCNSVQLFDELREPILHHPGPSAWSAPGKEDETGGPPNSISDNWGRHISLVLWQRQRHTF